VNIYRSEEPHPEFLQDFDMFEFAPRLHALGTNLMPSEMKVPWEQLLRRCSNLVNCSIGVNLYWWNLPNPRLPPFITQLSALTKLNADAQGSENLGDLFDGLVVPSMNDFRITHSSKPRWAQQQFLSLITRSSCVLTKLHFTDITMTDDQLIECLNSVHSLVEIFIRHYRSHLVTNKFLQRLIYLPSELGFLPLLTPRLEIISFKGRHDFDDEMFGDVVGSRWRVGTGLSSPTESITSEIARLKIVELNLYRDIGPKAKARLKKYEAEGLHSNLTRLV
jgi:hypothetical protein